jgi:hypothetical protein
MVCPDFIATYVISISAAAVICVQFSFSSTLTCTSIINLVLALLAYTLINHFGGVVVWLAREKTFDNPAYSICCR